MLRRASTAAPALLLCLALAACGEAVATRVIAALPTPTSTPPSATATSIPSIPTTTRPPAAAVTSRPSPSPTATRPRPAATQARTVAPTRTTAPARTSTPVAPLPAGVVAIPNMGASHVNDGQPIVPPHHPPSSGMHYPSAQPAGIYRQEIHFGYWVHSLEHGYVVALVRCDADCAVIFDQLQRLYDARLPESSFGNVKFIATTYSVPFTNGDAQIALVAWGYELLLPGFDADRILGFYERFVDQGPELVP